ncbi:hypothetical protein C9439_05595 [archaeon SCG-AAA382B04]|nr:hypothetical protein C9439_05595 [archaeon SCG-AAA382B04]
MSEILLIEEDSNFLDSAKNYLEDKNENLEIKTISSSEEAYELVKNNSYDCIVGDYQTIEDNDLELLEKVKKN